MPNVPLEDLVFLAIALVGGGLFVLSLMLDDRALSSTGTGGAGPRAVPLALAFIGSFGVGGLFATTVPDAHGVQAIIAAAGVGVVGVGLAFVRYGRRARARD